MAKPFLGLIMIGIGHSLAAAATMALARREDHYPRIILLDPPKVDMQAVLKSITEVREIRNYDFPITPEKYIALDKPRPTWKPKKYIDV